MNPSYLQRKHTLALVGAAALLWLPGCSKGDSPAKVTTQNVEAPAPDTVPAVAEEPTPEVDPETLAKQQKVKEALEKLEKESQEESARWTDELKASTKALTEKEFANIKKAIKATLAGAHRMPGNADRDSSRHPLETLTFFGMKPTTKVVEMGAGSGWYTEILAPVVALNGQLTIGTYSPEGPDDEMSTVYGVRQQKMLAKSPELYGKVKTFDLGADALSIGEPGSADLVLAIREMHGWQRRGDLEANLAAIVDVLAPGGVFGVVQHRAKADANAEESVEKGYLPEAWVIEKVEAAGLKLAKKSEINANPKDTKDYENGVWTLPPNLGGEESDKEKHAAIGESDRMTLRFEKPKAE